jgi:hypothetical protein
VEGYRDMNTVSIFGNWVLDALSVNGRVHECHLY